MKPKTIAKTQYREGYTLKFMTGFNTPFKNMKSKHLFGVSDTTSDIHIFLIKEKRTLLSAICHFGSMGLERGLWEIMPNNPPRSWGDSVKGHLTFREVIKYMDREIRLDKKV